MADLDRLYSALKAADAAGNTQDAAALAQAIKSASSQATPQGAPRWDVLGDIGRAAGDSASAVKQDFSNAFPSTATMDLGPVASLKRMGSALKMPLDALGVVAAPLTGALHGIGGSALSYVLPTPGKDIDTAGQRFYSDPKKAADQVLDSAMLGLAPSDPAALASGAGARAAAAAARSEALLKNKAIKKVAERAAADGLNPQDVITAQQQAGTDKLTLMDLGDKNVRGLAGAVHRAPGAAGKNISDFLKGRDEAAAPALTSEIQSNVAKGSTYSAVQDLLKSRSSAARPAYDAAESIGPIHSERLQQFLDTPEVNAGLKRGLKLERLNSISENRPFNPSEYAVTDYKDGNWDEPIFGEVPTMKSMIVANEGLGAQIADMINQVTGRPTKDGLALKKFRDAFQGELDSLSGNKYRAARDTWSGPAQSMEATQEGRQHFSRSESNDQLRAEFHALSPGDKDFYRMGAAEAKVDQLERAPDASDKSKRVINTERDRKRFRMLFDSDAQAQQFIDAVARKRQMFDTKTSVMGNSATAGRLAEDEDLAPTLFHGAHGVAHAAGGNWLGAAQSLYRAKRDLGLRNNPALNLEIARLLTEPNFGASGRGNNFLQPLPVLPRNNTLPKLLGSELLAAQNGSRSQRQ